MDVNTSDLQRRREIANLTRAELIERVTELETDLDKLNHAFEVGAFDGRQSHSPGDPVATERRRDAALRDEV